MSYKFYESTSFSGKNKVKSLQPQSQKTLCEPYAFKYKLFRSKLRRKEIYLSLNSRCSRPFLKYSSVHINESNVLHNTEIAKLFAAHRSLKSDYFDTNSMNPKYFIGLKTDS